MNIRHKLYLITAITIIVGLGLGITFITTAYLVSTQNQKAVIARDIKRNIFQRNILFQEYLLNPNSRVNIQLENKNNEIVDKLAQANLEFDNPQDLSRIDSIEDNYNIIRINLTQLFALDRMSNSEQSSVSAELRNRLINQVLIKSSATREISDELEKNSIKLVESIQLTTFFIIGVFIFLQTLTASGVLLVSRSINNSLNYLIDGVVDFTASNFKNLISIQSNDEFGKLAKTFNNMGSNLQESHSNLEEKISSRTLELSEAMKKVEGQNKNLQDAKMATLNMLEDMSEEKERFRAQVLETSRFKQAVESSTDGIVIVAPDHIINYLNPAITRMSAYTRTEAMGQNIENLFVHKNTPREELNRMQMTLKSSRLFASEKIIIAKKNGHKFDAQVSIYPIFENKIVKYYVWLIQDIEQRKAIDNAKSEFVSLASHQLRTPLTTVNWYTELLLAGDAGKITDEQRQYLDEIYTGNKRMVDLVNALLNVSRIDLGTFIVKPEPTNIIKLSQEVIKALEPKIFERKQDVNEYYAQDIPIINLDPKLIRIVIENLLSNAIKYTPEKGSVVLSITKNNENILLSVKDTGYGIPGDQQGKIFTKLFRADNIREKSTEGNGLGMYITRAIVQYSHGKIWFESTENKGSVFYVSLPISGMKQREGARGIEG